MAKLLLSGPVVDNTAGFVYKFFGMECITPSDVRKALSDIPDEEDVEVVIKSPGGYCIEGFEIYDLLASRQGKVSAYIVYAASIATVIACAADNVYMNEASIYMIHNTSSISEGDYRDHESEARILKEYNKSIIGVYSNKTGLDETKIQELMDDETHMAPKTAIELGFADGFASESPNRKKGLQAAAVDFNIISTAKARELMARIRNGEKLDESCLIEGIQTEPETINAENGGDAFQIETENIVENGGNDMTLDEFLAANPEAQEELNARIDKQVSEQVEAAMKDVEDAARQEGVDNENSRLKELDEISNSVSAEILNEAKYGEDKLTAQELAYKAMKENQIRQDAYMQNAISDANDANEVGTAPEEEIADNSGAEMAKYVNSKKEGR